MSHTIQDIATALGATALGAVDIEVTGIAEPGDARADQLALAMKPEYAEALPKGAARAAMVWDGADWQALGLEAAIIPPRPRFALSGLSAMMDHGAGFSDGIHDMAVIHETARLGQGVSVGPFTVIGAGAEIGDGTVIGPQCYVGTNARIGTDGLMREGARVGHGCSLGNRVILQPGAVVGGDGFSFVTPEESAVERSRASLGDQGEQDTQSWARIHSLGAVTAGDDVEFGSNCNIDRGTIRDTRIGNGTKIDSLAHVGHNVIIGTDCLICGQVGIAGSARIGNNCVFAGQVGIGDNLFVGDNVIAGGATKIMSNVPAGRVILGYPAVKMDQHVDMYKALRRLPRLMTEFKTLKARLEALENGDG
ncbi:MAG: UDP-3-O-(3-hydroxymyristoyl)glucosamine N-acyltransferase [Rhodobacterales bacterium]|nr:MAG: UDP-3-O-(3-hydroxymyristoyl)glucosamine N-acyltransferase [Rhodobacterales bacterium]